LPAPKSYMRIKGSRHFRIIQVHGDFGQLMLVNGPQDDLPVHGDIRPDRLSYIGSNGLDI